jgi:diguanylate cyclase (GGDEF)-like protein
VRRCAAALGAALLAFLTAPSARALDPDRAPTQYRHDHWSLEDGLPQSSVEAILQTRDGYLWLGTQEGLGRFDGVRFVVYDRSNTPALQHNRVVALYEDRAGTLWIGTEGGGLTRYRYGEFSTQRVRDGLPDDRVRAIVEDASGQLWIGTDGGLAVVRRRGSRGFERAPRLPGRAVAALQRRGGGGVWVGTEAGLCWVSKADGEPEVVAGVTSPVLSIWEGDDHAVWVGTLRGLLRLQGSQIRRYGSGDGIPEAPIHTVTGDRDGNVWVGIEGGGIARLHEGRIAFLTTQDGLSNDSVLRLLEDREGSLWIGMQDGGLDRLADGKFLTWTTREGLPGNIVWPIYGDREGNVWVGTSAGGLGRFRDGGFTTITVRQGLTSNAIQAIAQDRSGALWIGTRGGGLDRLAGRQVRAFTTRKGLPRDSVSALWPDPDGTLWVGMRGGGLALVKGATIEPAPGVETLRNTSIHDILRSRNGDLWIATDGSGLARLRGETVVRFTTEDGLSSNIVNTLHEDADGTLWIGTYGGGLVRLRSGRFSAYTTARGLFDDAVFSILDDGRGNLWMSCNKGVFRVSRREIEELDAGVVSRLHPVAYDKADGMRSRECNGANQPAGWRSSDGTLWFPTIQGAATINPAKIRRNDVPPPVIVEAMLVDGSALPLTGGLEIGPGKETLEIRYTATSLLVPERVRFHYKLEGFDRDWVEAGGRRVAFYTHVPPGTYRFVVKAANDDGVWNETGASLSFRLRPPFYRTPWFMALAVLMALGLASAAYRLQVRRVHAKEQTLIHLVEQRTRELEEANRALARLSSLDGLTGLLNRRAFDETLEIEWRRACRSETPISLILADIDFFKAYNDTYGHQGGDDCLRWVARTLVANCARAGESVARYGGEEFVALLPGTRIAQATALAERLRGDVEELGILHEGSKAAGIVTLSAGIATRVPRDGVSAATLVAAADRALYEAKARGRNRVVAADDRIAGDGPGG